MRVLWVSTCPWAPSSFGKVTKYMTRHLRELGFDVLVSCFTSFSGLRYDGFDVIPFGTPPGQFLDVVERRYGQLDVVVVHGSPWLEPLASWLLQLPEALKERRHLRVVGYFVHEWLEAPRRLKVFFKLVHRLVAPTRHVCRVVGADCDVVPHGYDPEVWRPTPRPRPGRPWVVAMVAKNHPRKQWFKFFEMVALLRRAGYDVLALPLTSRTGYWDLNAITETVAKVYGVDLPAEWPLEYDALTGLPEEVEAAILSRAHVHALVTKGEAYGMPILETLMLGVPNVVTRFPSIEEAYGDCVVYVEPDGLDASPIEGTVHCSVSSRAFAERVKEVLDQYDEHAERALKAAERLMHRTWDRCAKLFAGVLDRVHEYDRLVVEETGELTVVKREVVLRPAAAER